MQSRLSLKELAERIEGNKALKADFIAPTNQISMTLDGDRRAQLEAPGIDAPMPILPTAHGMIATHAGIPLKYYDRMRTEAPDLLVNSVNRWFGGMDQSRMIRTLGGDARALLSDRYARIENEEIAEATLPALLSEPGLQVVSCELTERRMYIQATTPRVRGEVKVGDEVQAGIVISNSEIGQGSVSIRPMVYRLVCLNGLIIPDASLRARHVGRRIDREEDLNTIFSDEARRADDHALLLKVRDVVRHTLSEAGFGQHLDKMRALTEPRIQKSPEAAVRLLAKKTGLMEHEQGGILEALMRGNDLSAWGVVNAVTAQAHTETDYDRAVEFETIGGQLLDLPRKEWQEILEAV